MAPVQLAQVTREYNPGPCGMVHSPLSRLSPDPGVLAFSLLASELMNASLRIWLQQSLAQLTLGMMLAAENCGRALPNGAEHREIVAEHSRAYLYAEQGVVICGGEPRSGRQRWSPPAHHPFDDIVCYSFTDNPFFTL